MPRVLELLAAAELEGEQMMRPRREGQPHEGHARVLAAGEGRGRCGGGTARVARGRVGWVIHDGPPPHRIAALPALASYIPGDALQCRRNSLLASQRPPRREQLRPEKGPRRSRM